MIATNGELKAMRDELARKIFRLHALKSVPDRKTETECIDRQIGLFSRRRAAICAALAYRRAEASRTVISLSRWASGGGVLDNLRGVTWSGGDVYPPTLPTHAG